MNKIEKLQNLSFEDLYKCITNLIGRIGYKNVKQIENTVIGEQQGLLDTNETHQFIVYDEKLLGNIDVETKKVEINELLYASKANVLYIVSNSKISVGFGRALTKALPLYNITLIDRDKLIELIDSKYPDFWKHNDVQLIEYEKAFCLLCSNESEVKKLKIFNEKYNKLLDIFIEPRIYHLYEDKKSNTPVRKRIVIEDLIIDEKNQIISGEAGTGKTTLLKKIGEKLVAKNTDGVKKYIPVFISATEIYENEYKLSQLLEDKLKVHFGTINEEFYYGYFVVILIDSIDELDKEKQKMIIDELITISGKVRIRYIIGTRHFDKIATLFKHIGFNHYDIEKFNNDQIKKFIARFFLNEESKADELVDSLRENRIIERLPITPLTLSLISILYEENNLEVPATIADIYDNFNSLIIGRATVTSRIQFIDISFKERILSLYALLQLEAKDHAPLSKEHFFEYFNEYYSQKTLPIKQGSLEEVLNYLIDHTGILVIKDGKWVTFSHDSYMEYYAALEIFKHQRDKESRLVDNFLEHNWQNAAIFYAGKSKDLPGFLSKVIDKLNCSVNLQDCFMGVLGVGYLLQALYQTDNMLRKEAVHVALRLSVNSYEITTKMASDNTLMFKNYGLPILQLMNVMYFYENFNSLTVKEPLRLAFLDLLDKYKKDKIHVDGYKAIKLALTLDSKRINYPIALEELIEEKELFRDPSLYLLLDFGLELFGKEKYKKLKANIKKEHFNRISAPVKELIKLPASRLRFTSLDTLSENRKVKLVVEGKTDAEIIEHAFICLTNGNLPYWNIRSAGNSSGGATEVAKSLISAKPLLEEGSILIGIFDHDSKGLNEFNRIKEGVLKTVEKDILRKHLECEIYALCLPIPGELDKYLFKEQELNYFEIEHYFDESFLKDHDMLEMTELAGNVYKIKEKRKSLFSKIVREQVDPKLFRGFIELFKKIDSISNVEIDYEE